MSHFIVYIIYVFIIGLFLYSKLLPYKDRLNKKYLGVFNFFNSVFSPILRLLNRFTKPVQVGQGLSVDMSQIVLLMVFLLILNFR